MKTRNQGTEIRRETEKDVVEQKPTSTFTLGLDVKTSMDIKKVLDARIVDSKVELSLGELLGIAKKEFHEVIIDVIQRKRQVTDETLLAGQRPKDKWESRTGYI